MNITRQPNAGTMNALDSEAMPKPLNIRNWKVPKKRPRVAAGAISLM